MHAIPEGCPSTLSEAFAFVNSAEQPSLNVLKTMVFVEAAGKQLYEGMALGTDHPGVQALLRHNGREEMAHAHRVARAIGALTGEDFPVPEGNDNPYLTQPARPTPVTRESLLKLARSEFQGEDLYARWADAVGHDEAANLFRQNGREESQHGGRLQEAAELLTA